MNKELLFYTENRLLGGGNKYFVDLINSAPKNFRVRIITNKNGFFEGDQKRLTTPATFNTSFVFSTHRLNRRFEHSKAAVLVQKMTDLLSPVLFLLNLVKFIFLLRKVKPGLVVSSNGGYPGAESTLSMVVAAKLLRIPVVLSVASMPWKRRKILWLYDYFLDLVLIRACSRVIVNSKAQINGLRRLRGYPAEKIFCIYNGIEDLKAIYTHPVTRKDENKIVLGYVGRLDYLKGVEYVLRALHQCRNRQKLRFVIVGDGPELQKLVQLSTELGIDEQIEFKGFVNESIYNIHQWFDVFVFPSLWEGLPYSVLEAMRSGLPIISTNVGGIPEAIDHQENGILVNPANIEELAGAIDLLVEQEELLKLFARNGRKKFETEFTLKTMEHRFQNLIINTFKPKLVHSE